MPSTRWAAAATLATASAIGTSAGSAARAASVGDLARAGIDQHALDALRGLERARGAGAAAVGVGGQTAKPPKSAAATLSGWPSSSTAWR